MAMSIGPFVYASQSAQEGVTVMSKLRVNAFGISIDGYGAGPDQDLANPMGVGGMGLHEWLPGTKTFRRIHADFAASLIGDAPGRGGGDDEFTALRPSWAAGALRYAPAVAARCAEHLRGLCLPYPPLAFLVTDLCPGMLVGSVATDGECFSSEDCAPGLSCASVGGCPRRCRAASASGEVCTARERCTAPSGGLGLCLGRNGEDSWCHAVQERPAAGEGAPCGMALASPGGEALVPCRDGLFCAPLGVSGKCQAVRAAGAACEGTDVPCVDGYLCRGGRCVAATVRDASGTSCDLAAAVVCSLVTRLACASGRCQPLGDGALGSRCAGRLVPFACAEGLACRPTRALADSTCQEPAPPGGYCAASADCESYTCDLTGPLSPRCGSRACF